MSSFVDSLPHPATELSEEQLRALNSNPDDYARYMHADEAQNGGRASRHPPVAAGQQPAATTVTSASQYEDGGLGGNARGARDRGVAGRATACLVTRSSVNPSMASSQLQGVMMLATATKAREMSQAQRTVAFDGLCDVLGVPEESEDRLKFYYSVIAWIFMNTASTENGIDSLVDRYSSRQMLEFFDHDLRPYARATASDAREFLAFVSGERLHPMHDTVVRMATQYGVPKTPWLLYDGIDGMKLTGSEFKLYSDIKRQRLSSSVNHNLDAAIGVRAQRGDRETRRPTATG